MKQTTAQQEKFWKDYEVQNPDGSWTTIADLLSQNAQEVRREVLGEVIFLIDCEEDCMLTAGLDISSLNNLRKRIAGHFDNQGKSIFYPVR